MALRLVVDNTKQDHLATQQTVYLGRLLAAAYAATMGEPLPHQIRDLLLSMDVDNVVADMRTAVALGL